MILLSIIVPVYNVANVIEQCVHSIFQQDYSNIEVILVNDGSSDGTDEICRKIKKLYSDIVYIYQENSGPSQARNVGIQKARGEYVIFLDGDDWWNGSFLTKCVSYIKANEKKPDMFICGAQKVNAITGVITRIGCEMGDGREWESGEEAIESILEKDVDYEWYSWRYLIRKEFLEKNNLSFTCGIYYEDVELIPRMICDAKNIVNFDLLFVNYRFQNPNSILNTPTLKKSQDKIIALKANILLSKNLKNKKTRQLFYKNISKLFLSAYGDFLNGYALEEVFLKENLWLLKYRDERFAKLIMFSTKVMGFKMGNNFIRIVRGMRR